MIPGIRSIVGYTEYPTTISFVSGAAGFTTNRTMPAGAAEGDFVIHFDYPGSTAPSGWRTILSGTNHLVIGKVIDAGEAAIVGSSGGNKIIQAFRPTSRIARWEFNTWNTENTGGNPASQVVPIPPVGSIVFGYYIDADGGTAAFGTATPAFDGENGDTLDGGYGRVGYKIYNPGSTPVSHTIDIADRGAQNILASGYVSLFS